MYKINVPAIHGFSCPTVQQGPEQNSLLKTILFSPWACKNPLACGSTCVCAGLLRKGPSPSHRASSAGGALQPVVDEGGRESLKPLILDLQATARGLDHDAAAAVERAIADADLRLDVCPTALAIPTQAPLDSFNARTYPACYVEWWFGDGAPGLDSNFSHRS